jgi:DNA (cytosine-5)-methyltransferase 1
MNDINAIDLFCGVGGLTHGLVKAHVNVVAGLDIDPTCAYPYCENNSAKFIQRDITSLEASELEALFPSEGLKLLAGCAPCQPFSTYSRRGGERRRSDDDWSLLRSFGRLIREVGPDLVTMENVPQLVDHEIFGEFLVELNDYSVTWSIVECADFGVPQTRKRLVLLASRFGDDQLSLSSNKRRRKTVRETIGSLPEIEAGGVSRSDPLHRASRLSDLNMRRIRASRPGGTWRDWPSELLATCHTRPTGDTYPSVYGRMSWDESAPTITTQCFGYGNGRFGHPEQDRAISLREAAMLQTFPRTYAFAPPGGRIRFNRMGRLIGNAVPVRLGEAIGKALNCHLKAYKQAIA